MAWHEQAGCGHARLQGQVPPPEASMEMQSKKMGCEPKEDKQGSNTRDQRDCDGSES